MKSLLKHIICFIFYYSGIVNLSIKLFIKRKRKPSVIILLYHRITKNVNREINNNTIINHPLDNFVREMRLLKRWFSIVTLDEAVDVLKNKKEINRPMVAITFDDGFEDNYKLAFPVLKELNIPATIFLTAGVIGTDDLPWVDKIGQAILNTERKQIKLNSNIGEDIAFRLGTMRGKRDAFNSITTALKEADYYDRTLLLNEIIQNIGSCKDENLRMLNWKQVREMSKNNITFGAHTVNHPILSKMPLELAKKEIYNSKSIIEENINLPVRHFAFPNGRLEDFTEELRNFCKDIGFESISTCDFGNNRKPSDVWTLKRVCPAVPLYMFAVNLVRSFLYKNKYAMPAIVLGMTVNGLGVVRSLARNSIKVYAFDPDKEKPAMHTRYAKCYVCPDVQKTPTEFKKYLMNFVKEIGGKAVLLPTGDAYNEFVNNNREELSQNFKFAMSPKEVMDQVLNKKGQYLLAKKFGIPIPETYFPQNLEEVQEIAPKLKYPVILKGLSTGKWRKKFGDKKAVIVNNANGLLDAYINIHDIDNIEPIIQEIIQGDDTQHYKICAYLDRDSNPLLTFTLQKIRQYPCDFGIGASAISVWEPQVAELGLRFMKAIGYYGVGDIEFKKDARDGKFKMIEINPRFWAQNSLADACGQNFSLTAYLDILGEKLKPETEFKEGIKWIAFEEDRTSFKGYHRQGRMSWGHWLKSILTGKRIWATWAWDDPMPFLRAIKFGFLPFEKVFLKIKEKIKKETVKTPSLRGGATCPERSRGKHRRSNLFTGKLCTFKNRIGLLHPATFGGEARNDGNLDSNDISLEIIKDFDSFLKLRWEWNTLLEKSDINNPFLRHEWLSAWWKAYGGDKKLFVVQFKKGDRTVGFAPFMKYKTKLTGIPIQAIGFISNHWTKADVILIEEHHACLAQLADLFKAQCLIVILAQMDSESANFTLFKKLEGKRIHFFETQKHNAYMTLNGTWEEYLKNQSANFRMDFNKKLRRLSKVGTVRLNGCYTETTSIIKQLQAVAEKSWQAKDNVNIIATKDGQLFYSEIIKEWKDKNILDFSILEIGDEPISYMVGVKSKNCYFAFDTAYNKDFQKYSPGMIIHNLLLEKLFNDGTKRFDFGYIADYKKRWTEQVSVMTDITIFPKSPLGTFLWAANKAKERFIKKKEL